MSTGLRFGIKTAQMGGSYTEMRDAWLEADALGFDTAWGHDHLLNQNDPAAPEEEGWTILAALLALTRRIRGGLMVTANTFRHPAVLAKMATTIDRMSGGRLEVGLGAGWFEGRYYQVREAYHGPKPVQAPHPPLVIGGKGEKVLLRIAAQHATEWNLANGTPEEFRHKCRVLDEHCRAVGRDPLEIERSIQFLPEAMHGDVAARARAFVAAGATHLIFTCPLPYSAEGARWLWREVVARIRDG